MINSRKIYKEANQLVQRHGTRDTLALARLTGIEVVPTSHFGNLLGMYGIFMGNRVIFLNEHMGEHLTQMVVGHELAHDICHGDMVMEGHFLHYNAFQLQNGMEYEANAFAAHILIDTEECVKYAKDGYDIKQISMAMGTHTGLMLIKVKELIRLGYELRLPMQTRSDFLKDVRPDHGEEWDWS